MTLTAPSTPGEVGESRELTPDEWKAIRGLRRLAKTWPKSLKLFSWSGTLTIMDAEIEPGRYAILDTIQGIPNDGGDPF